VFYDEKSKKKNIGAATKLTKNDERPFAKTVD